MNGSATIERLALPLAFLLAGLCAAGAAAAASGPAEAEVEGLGIDERLGESIPLDLAFRDDHGEEVTLADYFNEGKPVMLSLNFFQCPMLCSLQLEGAVEAMRAIDYTPGTEFDFVTLSFNPRETPTLARLWKQNYLKKLGRPEAGSGWHFLTGRQEQIAALTSAVGFRYRYDRENDTYDHPAALIFLTPDGRISRYLTGVAYDPKTLRLSLVEASEGKVGSPLDQFILYCFHFDAAEGRYTLAAMNVMRVGALMTALIIGGAVARLFTRERRARRERKRTDIGE